MHLEEERFGNPFSRFWVGNYRFKRGNSDSVEPEEDIYFYMEHFNGKENQEWKKLRDLKFLLYDAFSDSGVTPLPYEFEDFPKILLLSRVGDCMLEQKLAEAPEDERSRLNQSAGDLLFRFHQYARKVFAEIISEKYRPIIESLNERSKHKKPALEKAVQCLRDIKEDKGETLSEAAEKEFRGLYKLIESVCDSHENYLIHGDAGAQNIISQKNKQKWDSEDMKLVDLECLEFGDPMFDEADKSTSHNMGLAPEHWNQAIENYIRNSAGQYVSPPKSIWNLFKSKESASKIQIDDKAVEAHMSMFYPRAVHKPLTRIGYMHKLHKKSQEKYDLWLKVKPYLKNTEVEQGDNIKMALDFMIENPSDFIFSESIPNSLPQLRKFLCDEGIIPGKSELKEWYSAKQKHEELLAKKSQ